MLEPGYNEKEVAVSLIFNLVANKPALGSRPVAMLCLICRRIASNCRDTPSFVKHLRLNDNLECCVPAKRKRCITEICLCPRVFIGMT